MNSARCEIKGDSRMKASLCSTILMIGLALIFQGCGEHRTDKSPADTQPAQKLVSDLQSTLAQSRENLDREKERNLELMQRVQSQLDKLNEAEGSVRGSKPTEVSRGEEASDKKRIELMGAKAIAEYRAEQFRRRLDELSSDLDLKERELETIRQNSVKKDQEVQQLRQTIEELQAADRTRTAELNSRLEQITRDLEARSAVADAFKKDLDEKTELLGALKNAVSDASKLKSNAEAEITRLQGDLGQALRQLEASQAQFSQERQDLGLARDYINQYQTEIERLRQEVGRTYAETERSQQEAEQIRVTAESWKQQAEQFFAEAERSRQEAEQFRVEVDRARQEIVQFRVETDRAKQEANELRAQVSDLGGRLQTLEARSEQPDEVKPSSVDVLLESTSGTKQNPVSNLY
jgi:chromosome segregation ATPase